MSYRYNCVLFSIVVNENDCNDSHVV